MSGKADPRPIQLFMAGIMLGCFSGMVIREAVTDRSLPWWAQGLNIAGLLMASILITGFIDETVRRARTPPKEKE